MQTFKERVTLVYRIKIDVENPNHELKPGMPADATIELAERLRPRSNLSFLCKRSARAFPA